MEKLSALVAHERLVQKCFVDYDREMALVAERIQPETGQPEIIAVGRLTKSGSDDEGELAVLVSDRFQRHGLSAELVRRLIEAALATSRMMISGLTNRMSSSTTALPCGIGARTVTFLRDANY